MKSSFYNILDLNLWQVNQPNLPWRMSLTRQNGSVVTSGGINIPEAAVSLFSTAGFGRIPPKNLAKIIMTRFIDSVSNYPYTVLCKALLKDKGKFIKDKYQECSV